MFCTALFQVEKLDSKVDASPAVVPGELLPVKAAAIEINAGRRQASLSVTSVCDRPIQVGSHYHFIEANKYLTFDREAAIGMRLVSWFEK